MNFDYTIVLILLALNNINSTNKIGQAQNIDWLKNEIIQSASSPSRYEIFVFIRCKDTKAPCFAIKDNAEENPGSETKFLVKFVDAEFGILLYEADKEKVISDADKLSVRYMARSEIHYRLLLAEKYYERKNSTIKNLSDVFGDDSTSDEDGKIFFYKDIIYRSPDNKIRLVFDLEIEIKDDTINYSAINLDANIYGNLSDVIMEENETYNVNTLRYFMKPDKTTTDNKTKTNKSSYQ